MSSRSSQDGERNSESPGGGSDERERIRNQMKMVIGQLEGILQELKEVAKELREIHSICEGAAVTAYLDYTAEVQHGCSSYMDVKQQLHQMDLKYTLLFHAMCVGIGKLCYSAIGIVFSELSAPSGAWTDKTLQTVYRPPLISMHYTRTINMILKNKEFMLVVGQIDQLTSDFEFDMEPDDWTTATVSSTSSSEKGGFLFDLSHLDFMSSDILSDSWEFCSFLEASTPSDSGDGSGEQPGRPPDYRLMNGGLTPNGPGVETPDSSSEETFSSIPNHRPPQRTAGTRERVRFSDKVLYHALCCDDDEEDPDRDANNDQVVEAPLRCWDKQGVAASPGIPIATTKLLRPASKQIHVTGGVPYITSGQRKVTKNSSTQTVLDKSTQTVLPYVSDKQKAKGKN